MHDSYLQIYLIILGWVILSMALGWYEAKMFHSDSLRSAKFKTKYKFDIHIWFNFLRSIPWIASVLYIYYTYDIVESVYLGLQILFIFPFLHDGMYYTVRNKLNKYIYKKKWFDRSSSTSAIFSFNWYTRTLLFVIAMLFFTPY